MRTPRLQQHGVSMVEVLVALVIIAVGLLGMASAQIQAQKAEIESYQRAQAMLLAQDIAARLRANYSAARCYEVSGYIGQGDDPASCSGWGTIATRSLADQDLAQWDALLEGAAETLDGQKVGAMTGARGCVTYDGTADEYIIAVAWQGEIVTQEPSNDCASGVDYGGSGLRRVVTTTATIPDLD